MEAYFVPIPINFINTTQIVNRPPQDSPNSGSHTMPTRRKCYPKSKTAFEPNVTKLVTSPREFEKGRISEVVDIKDDDDIPPPLPPKSPNLLRRSQSRTDFCASRQTCLTGNSLERAHMKIDHAKVTGKPPLHRSNSMPCRRMKRNQKEVSGISDISNFNFQEVHVHELHKDTGLVEFKANGK